MKKLLVIGLLALGLGGCAQLQAIGTALQLGTASVANPVTKDRLNQIESAATIVFAGLDTWKKSCISLALPQVCRTQIASVQVYTRKIPPYLAQLRGFVRNNDQVNATVVWNQLTDLITTVKTQAAQANVNIGS